MASCAELAKNLLAAALLGDKRSYYKRKGQRERNRLQSAVM